MFMRVDSVEPGKCRGLDFFKARQRFKRGISVVSDGVADFRVSHVLDIRDEKADLARLQFVDLHWLGREHTKSLRVEGRPVRPQPNPLPLAQCPSKTASYADH